MEKTLYKCVPSIIGRLKFTLLFIFSFDDDFVNYKFNMFVFHCDS